MNLQKVSWLRPFEVYVKRHETMSDTKISWTEDCGACVWPLHHLDQVKMIFDTQ